VTDVQRATLQPVAEQLERARQPFTLMARVAAKTQRVDEFRLALRLRRQPPGLGSFEIAVEPGGSLLTLFGELVLIVKVNESTKSHDALLRALASEGVFVGTAAQWSRGQHTAERVLMVKPRIPSLSLALDACRALVLALHVAAVPEPAHPAPVSKRRPLV